MKNLKTIFGGPLAMVFLIFTAYTGHAKEPVYPPLTGRVVDAANVIPENDEIDLTKKLKDFEESSGHQFAVATIPDLGDMAIAEYSIGLGRHWKIGQSDIDDGILLVLTPGNGQPGTLKVRLEIGRGMEYILTDSATSSIVRNDIIDNIRNAETRAEGIPKGIIAGVDATIALGKITPEQKAEFDRKEKEAAAKRSQELDDSFLSALGYIFLVIGSCAVAFSIYRVATRKRRAERKAAAEEKAIQDAAEARRARAAWAAEQAEHMRRAEAELQNMLDAMTPHDRREFLLEKEADERQRRERMEEQRRHERLLNEQREEENRRRREEQSRQNDISFGGWSSGGGSSSDDNWRSSNSGGDSFSGGGGGDFGGGGSEGSL